MKYYQQGWFLYLFYFVALLVQLLPIGGYSIYVLDEAKNATAALEMWKNGEFILPTFNGELRYDKPPLHYYFFMLSYQIFGPSAFAARLFPALGGWLTLVLVIRFGRRHFNSATAYLAGSVLLASIHWSIQFRLAVPDPFLILFVTWSILEILEFLRSDYQAKGHLRTAALLLALAVLSKGPVALLLVGGSTLIFMVQERGNLLRRISSLIDPLAIGVFLTVALPWYILVSWETDGQWIYEFIFHHNLNRFASPMEGHGGGFYLPILMLIVGLFPGSLFLPGLLRQVGSWNKIPLEIRFALIFSAFTLLFFMISGTKLPNYIAPVYPMVALSLGWQMSKLSYRGFRWPSLIGSLFLMGFPAVFYVGSAQVPELSSIRLYWVVFMISGLIGLMGLVFWIKRIYLMNWILTVLGFWLFGFLVSSVLFPAIDNQNPVLQSEIIWKNAKSVYQYKPMNPAYPFALKRVIPSVTSIPHPSPESLIITSSRQFNSLDSLGITADIVFRSKDLFESTETVILKVK